MADNTVPIPQGATIGTGASTNQNTQTVPIPEGATVGAPPQTASANADTEQPGLLSRAYESSGAKGLVDLGKQEAFRPLDLYHSAVEKYKSGDWKGATVDALKLTKVVPDLNDPLNKAALSIITQPFEDVKADYDANRKAGMGRLKSAVSSPQGTAKANLSDQELNRGENANALGSALEASGQAIKPVPLIGSAVEKVTSLLDKDIHDKNWGAVAGDAIGPLLTLGVGKLLGRLGEAGEAAETRIAQPLETKATNMNPVIENNIRPGNVDIAGVKVPASPIQTANPPIGAKALSHLTESGDVQKFIDETVSPLAQKAVNKTLGDSANTYIDNIRNARGVPPTATNPVQMSNPDEIVDTLENETKPVYSQLDKVIEPEIKQWVKDKAAWEKSNPKPEKPEGFLNATTSGTPKPYEPPSAASMAAYKKALEAWEDNNNLWNEANPKPRRFTEIQKDINANRNIIKRGGNPEAVRVAQDSLDKAFKEREDFVNKYGPSSGVDQPQLDAVNKAWKASTRFDYLSDRLRSILKPATEGKSGLKGLPPNINFDALRNVPAAVDNKFGAGTFNDLVGQTSRDNFDKVVEVLQNPKLSGSSPAIREAIYAHMGNLGIRTILNPFSLWSNLLFNPDFADTMIKWSGKAANKANVVPKGAAAAMVVPKSSQSSNKQAMQGAAGMAGQ